MRYLSFQPLDIFSACSKLQVDVTGEQEVQMWLPGTQFHLRGRSGSKAKVVVVFEGYSWLLMVLECDFLKRLFSVFKRLFLDFNYTGTFFGNAEQSFQRLKLCMKTRAIASSGVFLIHKRHMGLLVWLLGLANLTC